MARLGMIVLLVAAVLGGCGAGGARGRPHRPDVDAEPDRHPGLGPAPAGRHRGRLPGVRGHPQQYQRIGQRVHEVIVRQKPWDQGVRFGAGVNQGKHHVLIGDDLSRFRFVIRDRDAKFTTVFAAVVAAEAIKVLTTSGCIRSHSRSRTSASGALVGKAATLRVEPEERGFSMPGLRNTHSRLLTPD